MKLSEFIEKVYEVDHVRLIIKDDIDISADIGDVSYPDKPAKGNMDISVFCEKRITPIIEDLTYVISNSNLGDKLKDVRERELLT